MFPLFVQPNSTQVCGIHISQKVDGEWQNLVDIPNFKEKDFSMDSDIGSAGFKLVETKDSPSRGLLLFCDVKAKFADKLDIIETLEGLDRFMKVLSNMVAPAFYPIQYQLSDYTIKSHLNELIKDKDYDCSQIDDNLNGDSACHLMNSD